VGVLNLIAVIPRNLRRARPNKFIREFVPDQRQREDPWKSPSPSASVKEFGNPPLLPMFANSSNGRPFWSSLMVTYTFPYPFRCDASEAGRRIGARALLRHRLEHGSLLFHRFQHRPDFLAKVLLDFIVFRERRCRRTRP